jgi:F1F0 ATPase subunit 2
MNEWMGYLLCAGLGGGLSLFFVGGLWWSLQRVQQGRWPGRGLVLSFLVRLAAVAVAFGVLALGGHWRRVLVAGVAFVMTRPLWVGSLAGHRALSQGGGHAD